MILRALLSAGLAAAPTLLAPAALAPRLPAQEPPAMLATAKYLFVIRGDWLYQYDVDTLVLKGRTQLPSAGPTGRRAVRRGGGQIGMDLPPEKPRVRATPIDRPEPEEPAATRDAPERVLVEMVTEEPAEEPVMGGAGGRFGGRGGRNARGKKSEGNAIQSGLKWLAAHQDESGRWDADGFMKHDTKGEVCGGPGSAVHDVGVTGLAMLAMLGDGSTLRSGPYKDNLKRATKWLKDQQGANGRFGSNQSHDFIYDHAIATYAMCEVYGLSALPTLKRVAQNGINYLESHRNPYSVWRYQPRDNDNDISVTSWCLLACASGEFFNLEVNKNAMQLGATFLDQVSQPNGKHGYTKAGEGSSRMPGEHASRYPIDKCEALTAAGLFCRYFLGQDPKDKPVMKAAADLIAKKPPRWDTKAGTIDHYYWYYGTYAMFQTGGKHWKTWSASLKKALLPHQHQQGNLTGSWDPAGVWGEQGGRVYSTAMSVLALEAYYRYSRLVR